MQRILSVVATMSIAGSISAGIKSETIDYKYGDTTLEGVIAYDHSVEAKRPGILVVHDWMGNGEFSKKRAERLAELGYVGFAVDMYGKGVRAHNPMEADKLAGGVKSDQKLMRGRIQAALDVLQNHPRVNSAKLGALGFCFGGTVSLELARSGAPVAGVVSFHGGLATENPADAKNIKGKVLALHGADDPFVKDSEVAGFEKEMRDAAVDWQVVKYGNAVHSFTNPAAGTDNSKGAAYNEAADKRSYEAMKDFFAEVFGK
jgi:dienelactone hydrolase